MPHLCGGTFGRFAIPLARALFCRPRAFVVRRFRGVSLFFKIHYQSRQLVRQIQIIPGSGHRPASGLDSGTACDGPDLLVELVGLIHGMQIF